MLQKTTFLNLSYSTSRTDFPGAHTHARQKETTNGLIFNKFTTALHSSSHEVRPQTANGIPASTERWGSSTRLIDENWASQYLDSIHAWNP